MNAKKNRIYIFDPSLVNRRGHHYTLTTLVTKGAKSYANKVIWLVNKHFSPNIQDNKNASVYRFFTYNFYQLPPKIEKTKEDLSLKNRTKTRYFQRYLRFFFQITSKLLRVFNNRVISKNDFLKNGFIENKLNSMIDRVNNKISWISNARVQSFDDMKHTPYQIFYEELKNFLQIHTLTNEDIIVIHTAEGVIYRGIFQLFLDFNSDKLPNFHISTPYNFEYMPFANSGDYSLTRIMNYMKSLDLIDKKVYLYAETQPLAEYYRNLLDLDIDTLNLPPHPEQLKIEKKAYDLKTVVLYAGAAREEKGFHLLPEIIETVLNSDLNIENLHFKIQMHPQNVGYTPIINNTIQKLKEMEGVKITFYTKELETDQYYNLIENCDIILLCYDYDKYKTRGSGIAVDALCAGKIIVGTAGTYGAFLSQDNFLQGVSARDFASSIIYAVNNKSELLIMMSRARKNYIDKNSSEAYVKKIITRAKKSKNNLSNDKKNNLIKLRKEKTINTKNYSTILKKYADIDRLFFAKD
jgi:glycosyltransferase involved in cell wall biosynthesis